MNRASGRPALSAAALQTRSGQLRSMSLQALFMAPSAWSSCRPSLVRSLACNRSRSKETGCSARASVDATICMPSSGAGWFIACHIAVRSEVCSETAHLQAASLPCSIAACSAGECSATPLCAVTITKLRVHSVPLCGQGHCLLEAVFQMPAHREELTHGAISMLAQAAACAHALCLSPNRPGHQQDTPECAINRACRIPHSSVNRWRLKASRPVSQCSAALCLNVGEEDS